MRLLISSAVCIVLSVFLVSQPHAQNPPTWKVNFVAGPTWPGSRSVEMTVAADALTLSATGKKQRAPLVLKVPLANVQSIVYSPARFNRADQLDFGGASGGYPPGDAVIGELIVYAIASGMHGQKHYVTVRWEQDAVEQEFEVEAPKQIAPVLIEALERAAGPKWMNLEQRCNKVRSELARQRDKAFTITFDQPVRLSEFHLAAGPYQAVLLNREANSGELYLFAGQSVEESNLKAITSVQIGPAAPGVTTPEVKLDSKTLPAVTEVRTPQTTLKFR